MFFKNSTWMSGRFLLLIALSTAVGGCGDLFTGRATGVVDTNVSVGEATPADDGESELLGLLARDLLEMFARNELARYATDSETPGQSVDLRKLPVDEEILLRVPNGGSNAAARSLEPTCKCLWAAASLGADGSASINPDAFGSLSECTTTFAATKPGQWVILLVRECDGAEQFELGQGVVAEELVAQAPEETKDPTSNSPSPDISLSPIAPSAIVCGDGTVDGSEECDDGNARSNDGCDASCRVEVISNDCGNGFRDPGETCDEAGLSPTCDGDCTAARCGDGFVNPVADEQCDDGNTQNGDGCDATCNVEEQSAFCGNGFRDPGETCDEAGLSPTCDGDCTAARCGDGFVNPVAGEQCDDGNNLDGDGCDATCGIDDGADGGNVGGTGGGTTYYVDRPGDGLGLNGSNANPGTADRPFATITKAAGIVLPGDTVLIKAGTYPEKVQITRSGVAGRPIVFRGGVNGEVIIDGGNTRPHGMIIYGGTGIPVEYVNFSHLTFRNAVQDGLHVINAHYLDFDRIICKENGNYGSFWGGYSAGGTHDITVRRSFFFKNGQNGDLGAGMRIGGRTRHFVYNMLIEDCVSHSNAAFRGASAETATGFNINSPQTLLPFRATHTITLRRCMAYNNGSSGITSQLPGNVLWEDCISFDNNVANTPDGEGFGFRFGFAGEDCSAVRCIAFNNRSIGIAFENIERGSVYNCLAYRNAWQPTGNRKGFYSTGSAVEARNNISFDNNARDVLFQTPDSDYNFFGDGIISGNGDANTLSGDPRFVNPPLNGADLGVRTWINGVEINGDDLTTWLEVYEQLRNRFALRSDSPCIDAGIFVPGVTDGYGGAAPDIGPFEFGN